MKESRREREQAFRYLLGKQQSVGDGDGFGGPSDSHRSQ